MANLLWHAMGSFTAALPADIRCNQNETTMNESMLQCHIAHA